MIPLFPQRTIPLYIGLLAVAISSTFKPNFSAGSAYKAWMGAFLLFIMISTLWSINAKLTIYTLTINVFPIFCLMYSLARYIDSYARMVDIFKLIYVAGVISLIYLYLFIDLTMLAGNRINLAMTDENLAENWNANAIGMNLALTILFGYLISKYSHNKIYWILWIVISLAMMVVIMLSGSRKAILCLIIPFIIYALFNYRRHFFKALLLIVAAFGLVWLALNIPFFYDIIGRRIENMVVMLTGNDTGMEDTSRRELIFLGLEWFEESPILGYGMNCFRVLSNKVPRFMGQNFYAHNNYVELLVGGGIVGFSVYYSYVVVLLRRLFRHKGIYNLYAVICLGIVLFMDFAEVSYYDVIMQLLILFAFIFLRFKNVEVKTNKVLS